MRDSASVILTSAERLVDLQKTWTQMRHRRWCPPFRCQRTKKSDQRKGNASQRARLHVFWIPTGDTLNKAYLEEWPYVGGDSSEEQNAIGVPMHNRPGAGQLKRARSEGDHGFTNNKKRDYENERSTMHDDSCIGIYYAHRTLTCSPSVSGHFTHCWVSLCTSCRQFK